MSEKFIQLIRKPTQEEQHILEVLVAKTSKINLPAKWLETLEVQEMDDGGMGSLRLIFPNTSSKEKVFGKQASELVFNDEDGVKVVATLNLDSTDMPIELDLWKTDFSPLIRIPKDLI